MENKAVFFFVAHVVIPDATFSTKDHPVIENENVDPQTVERSDCQFIWLAEIFQCTTYTCWYKTEVV